MTFKLLFAAPLLEHSKYQNPANKTWPVWIWVVLFVKYNFKNTAIRKTNPANDALNIIQNHM